MGDHTHPVCRIPRHNCNGQSAVFISRYYGDRADFSLREMICNSPASNRWISTTGHGTARSSTKHISLWSWTSAITRCSCAIARSSAHRPVKRMHIIIEKNHSFLSYQDLYSPPPPLPFRPTHHIFSSARITFVLHNLILLTYFHSILNDI